MSTDHLNIKDDKRGLDRSFEVCGTNFERGRGVCKQNHLELTFMFHVVRTSRYNLTI